MRIICAMAANEAVTRLTSVTQGHIDSCIYVSPANLTFAERMADLGAQVCVSKTIAISVDRSNWQTLGGLLSFGGTVARLDDPYALMGCKPSFTCTPCLRDGAPAEGENIAWAESNALIFAKTVFGGPHHQASRLSGPLLFHHNSNPAWQVVAINERESTGFGERAYSFTSRRLHLLEPKRRPPDKWIKGHLPDLYSCISPINLGFEIANVFRSAPIFITVLQEIGGC